MMSLSGVRWLPLFVAILTACGGGGGTKPTPVSKLVGTVAVGQPIVDSAVALKCVGGTATGKTDGKGLYSIEVPAPLEAPCILKASSAAGDLVSVSATRSGTANITPLTHLLVAKLLEAPPSDSFSGFSQSSRDRIALESISAAQGIVAAEVLKIGAALPSASWISQPFSAQPGDAMDGALELLARKLAEQNKTLEGAAVELASGPLYPSRPLVGGEPECVPGLISGFNGEIQDAITRVVRARNGQDPGGSGDAPGGTGDGASGVGIGGSLGQFVNVHVTVHVADGPTFGPVMTDSDKGMVTFVPCSLQPPLHIKFEGKPGSNAMYYDEKRKELVSFENLSVEGVATRFDRNVGVTPFTDAIVRRARALEDRQVASGGFRLAKVVKASEGWKDPARLQIAHDEVRAALNDQLPGIFRLDDLTRLPVMLNKENDRAGSGVLTNNQNGIYGAVVGGFARSAAGNDVQQADAPAYRRAEQFSLDMTDGRLDQKRGNESLWSSGSEAAYDVDQFWIESSVGTGQTSRLSGDPDLSRRQGIVATSRAYEKLEGERTSFHSTSGLLTFVEACRWQDGKIPGRDDQFCKNETIAVGRFAQVQSSPNAGLSAISEDRRTLAIYPLFLDVTTPPGTPPPRLATFHAPDGATFSAIRSGLIFTSDGSTWRVRYEHLQGPDGPFVQYTLDRVVVPAEVTRGEIGYFTYWTVPGDLAPPLGYGIGAAGEVIVWRLENPEMKRTMTLPVPVIQLSTDHQQVIARTQDGQVYWMNPEHATRWIEDTATGDIVEKPVFPTPPPPIRIEDVDNACWIAMPVIVACDGSASRLAYEMSSHPNAFGYSGFDVIEGAEAIPGLRPIWRALPASRFGTGRESGATSNGILIGVDGTLYSEDGSPQDVPDAALE